MIALLVVYGVVELLLLLALADYGSWQVAALEILVSALLGVAVLRYVSWQFGRKILSRLAAGEFPGDALADGAIIFIAGMLLILPGLIGDLLGLLLLIPPIRWMVVGWLRRRYAAHADASGTQFVHTCLSEDPSRGEITLDAHSDSDPGHADG